MEKNEGEIEREGERQRIKKMGERMEVKNQVIATEEDGRGRRKLGKEGIQGEDTL